MPDDKPPPRELKLSESVRRADGTKPEVFKPSASEPQTGPVFPSISATRGFHMLAETNMPAAPQLKGRYHLMVLPILPEVDRPHNPTLWLDDSGLRVIVRVLRGARTTNWTARVSDDLRRLERPVRVRQTPYTEQIEDLRVFSRPDGLWAVATMHDGQQPPVAIRQAIVALSEDGSAITRAHPMPSPRHEKNWMPCVLGDGHARFVYSTQPLIVLDMENVFGVVGVLPRVEALPRVDSYIRGGSQLIPWKGGFLSIVHRVYKRSAIAQGYNPMLSPWTPAVEGPLVVYQHHFAFFDKGLDKVTVGSPWYFRHLGVEFCAGLVRHEGRWIASFGQEDKEAWLVEFEDDTVMKTFVKGGPVETKEVETK